MQRLLTAIALLALGSAVLARAESFADDKSLNDVERYKRCLDLVRSAPDNAYEQALAWHDAGGGPASIHCSALALVQLRQYGEAAFKLDGLAHERDAGDAGMRAELLDQAGNAWLLAGQPQNALGSFSAAVNLGADDADVLSDRARARAMLKDWTGADADLTKALAKDQYRADLLVLRASARRAMGRKPDAIADLNQAIDLDPHYADALVDRGNLKLESGDLKGAKADWQVVLATQPKSAAAETVRARIQDLEVSARSQPAKQKPKAKPQTTRH